MKKKILLLFCLFVCFKIFAQKVESISFNLYTDSLKKTVHNYINVDGKLSNGKYMPLDATHLTFTSNYGIWEGNSLIIDSSYKKDSVVVTATLKQNTTVTQSITIYLKKNNTAPKLKSEQEILNELDKPRKKKN